MKKAFWLLTGIAAGLVIAKQLDENPRAQAVVDDAAKRAKDFGAAIAEGFRERETELASAGVPAAKATSKATGTASKAAPKKTSTASKAKTTARKSNAAKPANTITK